MVVWGVQYKNYPKGQHFGLRFVLLFLKPYIHTHTFMKSQAIIFAVAALIVGAAAGYFFGVSYGKKMGYEAGYTAGVEAGIAKQKEAQNEQEAASAIPAVVNPAEKLPSTNPLEDVKINPFEGIQYVNPFD